ncbi:Elongation_factor Tu GTP binding domain-containing protein [Hexamita inflata]|uniref:Elongation factor Tu GTP binding domain-containing protein n=1 Tax=Hexamita inflata TaxID=28002 RepID=A0AA86TZT1_9EUKA|nr:Elongation factor Tu GTP binding domain-containing protein [Hexamita inflata]
MSYDYDDEFDDLDDFDFVQAAKDKKAKQQKVEQSAKERSTPNTKKPEPVNPDAKSTIIPQQVKLSTSSSQKYLGDLLEQFNSRQLDDKSAIQNLSNQIQVITMGNVDAGKSTIFGHLYHLMNKQSHELEKITKLASELNRDSFKWAFFLDTNQSERERGVTIAVNTYELKIENKTFIMQDCPGHQDFSDSICSSVIQPNVGVLVIEAHQFDRLIEQVREQLNLLLIFDIQHLLVVVNKMDLVDFKKKVYKEICEQIKKMLTNMQIFKVQCAVQFIPCAGVQEIDNNLIEYTTKMQYAETTLKQALMTTKPKALQINQCDPVLLIQDMTVSDGKITSTCYVLEGHLYLDDVIYISPNNLVFSVNQIYDLNKNELKEAVQSQVVILQLQIYQKNVPKLQTAFPSDLCLKVRPGSLFRLLGSFLSNQAVKQKQTKRIRAKLFISDHQGICAGEEFDSFVGLRRVEIRVNRIDAILEGEKFIVRGQFCGYGQVCVCDLILNEDVFVQKEGVLRRIIIRRGVQVAGVGFVEAWQ